MAEIQIMGEIERVCSLLENEYRRRVLRILGNASGTMTRDKLSRTLAQDSCRTKPIELVDTSLYHVHLPKLADENAIRYDSETETVAITEDGEQLLQCLDVIERRLTRRK